MVFQKGQCANPKGRPKRKKCFTDQLRRYLNMPFDKIQKYMDQIKTHKCKLPALEVFVITSIFNGMKGRKIATALIDRLEGKLPIPLKGVAEDDDGEDLSHEQILQVTSIFLKTHGDELKKKAKAKPKKKKATKKKAQKKTVKRGTKENGEGK